MVGAGREPRDVVLRQDGFDEVVVLGWHDDVDTIGLAVQMLVDPPELGLEFLRSEVERAEDPEVAGAVTAATTSRQWLNAKSGDSSIDSVLSGVHLQPPYV